MKDERGHYYHPFPHNKRVRMYVRKSAGTVWFRMWNTDDEKLWEEHGWVPYEAVKQAAAMYDGKNFDPGRAYDLEVAEMLLKTETGDDASGHPGRQ